MLERWEDADVSTISCLQEAPFHVFDLSIHTRFCSMKIFFFIVKMFEKNKNRVYKIFITFICTYILRII